MGRAIRQTLAEYAPTVRFSGMDRFFKAGKKAYGVTNEGAYTLGKYSTQGKGKKKPGIFDIVEYYGSKKVSKGGNIDAKKNKELSQMAKILSKEAPKGHVLAYIKSEEKTKTGIPSYRYGGHHGDPAGTGTGAQGPAGGQSSGGNYGGGDTSGNAGSSGSQTTSVRDSGMVSTSTGYGPLGAGGEALGPDGNQGGGSYNNDTDRTTTYANTEDTDESEDKTSIINQFKQNEEGFFTTDFNVQWGNPINRERPLTPFVGIRAEDPFSNPNVDAQIGITFKKGGLLDRKRFKKA